MTQVRESAFGGITILPNDVCKKSWQVAIWSINLSWNIFRKMPVQRCFT